MWVCFRDESLDPISCLLPIPISIFALWKLASVPKRRICKWLCELEAPFSATAQMLHKRTIWSRAVRDPSRDWEQASSFCLYVHKPPQPGGFQCLARPHRYTNRNTVTHIIHHLTVNTMPSSTHDRVQAFEINTHEKHKLIWLTLPNIFYLLFDSTPSTGLCWYPLNGVIKR